MRVYALYDMVIIDHIILKYFKVLFNSQAVDLGC